MKLTADRNEAPPKKKKKLKRKSKEKNQKQIQSPKRKPLIVDKVRSMNFSSRLFTWKHDFQLGNITLEFPKVKFMFPSYVFMLTLLPSSNRIFLFCVDKNRVF